MAYPMFLSVVGTVVVVGYGRLFRAEVERMSIACERKGNCPAITEWLLGVSEFLRNYGLYLLVGIRRGLLSGGSMVGDSKGKAWFDRFRLAVAATGADYSQLRDRPLHTGSGDDAFQWHSLLTALRIAKDSTGNVALTEAISKAADNVTTGRLFPIHCERRACFLAMSSRWWRWPRRVTRWNES